MAQHSSASHHRHVRKRLYSKHEALPSKNAHKRLVDRLVYAVGILTPLFTIPQVLVIWLSQSAGSVSLLTWGPYLLFAVVWLWYGIIHREWPIIVLNAGLVIVDLLVVAGILVYG